MNIVWLFSYLTDGAFALLHFRRENFALNRQRPWLKLILLLLLIPLYLNDTILAIPYSSVRVIWRVLIYFCWLYWAEGVPGQTSAYAALFWTTVYTLFQNIFFGPCFYDFFVGDIPILPNPLWNEMLVSAIAVMARLMYFGGVALLFPFSGMAGSGTPHIGFAVGVCAAAIYTKSTGTILLPEFGRSPVQFSAYFILLHAAMLLFLIIFEYSRRQAVKYAAITLQNTAAQALLESIRDRQQSEESIRSLRHDLKNHAITLQLLLEEGNTAEAIKYLCAFQEQAAAPTNAYRTGNDLLDGLLRQKLSLGTEYGVDVAVSLDFRQGGFIAPFDLCVLMGNVLDNAVEACLKVSSPDRRFIEISGGCSANCLLVRVKNSCIAHTAFAGGLPHSTKADKTLHGFGLRNTKRVLGHYHGNLTISMDEDGCFIVTMLIPIPEQF